jgi:acyl-CoA synthetase (AMP-forming)/AMP-acid ligase II
MTVFGNFVARHARRWPDRPALVFEGETFSYGQLFTRAAQFNAALRRRGLQRLDRVGMLAMNRTEWADVIWGCALSDVMLATINYRLAGPEVLFVLNDCAPRILIFEDRYAELIEAIRPQIPSVETFVCLGACPAWAVAYDAFLAEGADPVPPPLPAEDDYAMLIYTSGTTGRPKGVIKSQAACFAMYRSNAFNLGMRPTDRILLTMPMFHVGALSEACGMFLVGGTVVLHAQFDPKDALASLEQDRITHVHMAPTMVQALLDRLEIDQRDLSSLRVFNYAAAPMPVTLLRRAIERFGKIFVDIYGQTECGGTILHAHQHVLEGAPDQVRRLGSVGQSTPNTELRVVDEAGRNCPAGVPGEILLKSDNMMSGYWNNSLATIETMRDGWVRSGDIGYLDENEYLFLVDRKKDMIISGGENIYCREVEEALLLHGGLEDVAVIGLPDPYWGEAVHAVAIRKPGSNVGAEELIAFCETQIARYKRPRSIEFVTDLPRLPSGKVTKHVLRARYQATTPTEAGA